MPYLIQAGTPIYYESHGTSTPLLFVHGMFGNHAAWFQQVAALTPTYRVITLDLRGFGVSGDDEALDVSRSTSDLEALLDELAIERVTLIAQSYGGNAALAFAIKNPHRLHGLVMAGTLGGVTLPKDLRDLQRDFAAAAQSLSTLQRMFSAAYQEREPALAELFAQLLTFNRAPANLGPRPQAGTATPAPTLEQLAELAQRVSLLLYVGEHDVVQPAELVRGVAEFVPSASFEVEPGAGHSVFFEKPEAFNNTLRSFLANVMAGTGVKPGVSSPALASGH